MNHITLILKPIMVKYSEMLLMTSCDNRKTLNFHITLHIGASLGLLRYIEVIYTLLYTNDCSINVKQLNYDLSPIPLQLWAIKP